MNLTISPYSAVIIENNGTLECDIEADSYQWINCTTQQDIVGETSATFTPIENGDYALVTELGTCSETSNCITINSIGLGINEQVMSTSFSLYPNPASNYVTVKSSSNDQFDVVITNSCGQLIKKINNVESLLQIDLSKEAPGVYFIKIQTMKEQVHLSFSKL